MDKPWKVILAFVGVFMAGAVFGGLFTLRASAKRIASDPGFNRPVGPPPIAGQGPQQVPVASTPQPPKAGTVPPSSSQIPSSSSSSANRIAPALMNQLTKRLNPTADQRERIRPFISRATEDLQRMQREHLQDTTRVYERMYEDVRAVLSPEQRTQLDKMRQEMLERVRKERERRGELQTKGGAGRPNAQSQPNQPGAKVQQGP